MDESQAADTSEQVQFQIDYELLCVFEFGMFCFGFRLEAVFLCCG